MSSSSEPLYDLYAISNHFGGLGGGHYTAYCKNAGKWYEFNDSSCRGTSEGSITGSGAYILFYKRRDWVIMTFIILLLLSIMIFKDMSANNCESFLFSNLGGEIVFEFTSSVL